MTAIRKREGHFVETEVDGEVVVMNMDSGAFYALDTTALSVWRAIDGVSDRDALIARLAADFGENTDAIAADVDEFLASLREAKLLHEPQAT